MRRLDVGSVVSGAWEAYLGNIGTLVLGGLIASILSACFVIAPPMMVGLNIMCLKALRGQQPEVNDVFAGFQKFGDSWIVAIVPGLIMVVLFAILGTPIALMVGHQAKAGAAMGGAMPGFSFAMLFGYMLIMGVAIVIVMPLLGLAFPAVADGLRGGEALGFAWQRGVANWGTLFLVALVIAAVTIIIGSVPLAGLLISPWTAMLLCKAYLMLTEGETPAKAAPPAPYTPAPPPAPAPEAPEAPAPEAPAPKPEDIEQPPAPEDEAPPAPPA